MQQVLRFLALISTFLTPLLVSGHVFAYSQSIAQEITVTAVVPAHRDIVVDAKGRITEIDSNTKDDVTPDVYVGSVAPANKQSLTDEMLTAYRKLVPLGTAKYGVLYKWPVLADLFTPNARPTNPADTTNITDTMGSTSPALYFGHFSRFM